MVEVHICGASVEPVPATHGAHHQSLQACGFLRKSSCARTNPRKRKDSCWIALCVAQCSTRFCETTRQCLRRNIRIARMPQEATPRGRLRKRKIKHAKPLLTQMFDCSWHFHHGNCNCPTLAKCRTPLQIESQNTSRANQPSAVLTATARTHAFPPVEYGPPAAC